MLDASEEVIWLRAAIDRAHVSPALRARVERHIADAQLRRTRRRRLSLGGALAAAAATAAALVLIPGRTSAPSVEAFVEAAAAAPAAAAPAVDSRHPQRLMARVGSVWFPNWEALHWPAVGRRDVSIRGRRATTVYYAGRNGTRIGYIVVAGGPLPWPDQGRALTRGGMRFQLYSERGSRVVTWRNRGHQCVILAPRSIPESRLVELAIADS